MKKLVFAAALASAMVALPLSASADSELGSLVCHSNGSTGFIIGSSENLVCEFTPANSQAPHELYNAKLDNFGLDVGVTGETVMQWTVLSVGGNDYKPWSLAGTYGGASADASFAAGGGVKVLAGADNGLTLQPISVQAQSGVNAAIGVTKFTLSPAGNAG
ncbi:DUF992 domain-containing protein [Consotaella salsifontis]|uniref:DUF992 domain-containing protein n=1 Tax=Consotaella salsifontis TaxID=1365950 RepID=A0A1T4NNB4_9HYPH|nr:DUF992 domain-containing protein [Consotaella salsifontis]SJZ80248.1 Protein of unknown function [Consotaella salsifontis]